MSNYKVTKKPTEFWQRAQSIENSVVIFFENIRVFRVYSLLAGSGV
jgi:hypothetical protein